MKYIKKVLIIAFAAMLALPLLFTNLKPGAISEAENRALANPAKLHNDDGTRNDNYLTDVSTWFNDNVGFRPQMVVQYARIQYYIFNNLFSKDFKLGPHGEWNWVSELVIPTYSHTLLYTEQDLESITKSVDVVNDYLSSQGVQFYYMQCYDKQSIYPEYFPKSVNQYGPYSRTDQLMDTLSKDSSLNVIDTKPDLVAAKKTHECYSKFGDATHWANPGAYIGYRQLMEDINRNNNNEFRVLDESDYDLTPVDQGVNMFGGVHKKDMIAPYTVKSPSAVSTQAKFLIDHDSPNDKYFTNSACGNNKKILILGDSYIHLFIADDIAESFGETIFLMRGHTDDIVNLVNEYHPDIVLFEQVEREQDLDVFDRAAANIQSAQQ